MSGFEVAGIVLGAFPLAIESIKAYRNGVKTIKDMKEYRHTLLQFARDLMVEKYKYHNTLLELLGGLADTKKIEQMMADLNSIEWKDKNFRTYLKGRLRPAKDTLDNWLSVAKQLNDTLKAVAEKFKLPTKCGKQVHHSRSPNCASR